MGRRASRPAAYEAFVKSETAISAMSFDATLYTERYSLSFLHALARRNLGMRLQLLLIQWVDINGCAAKFLLRAVG